MESGISANSQLPLGDLDVGGGVPSDVSKIATPTSMPIGSSGPVTVVSE